MPFAGYSDPSDPWSAVNLTLVHVFDNWQLSTVDKIYSYKIPIVLNNI